MHPVERLDSFIFLASREAQSTWPEPQHPARACLEEYTCTETILVHAASSRFWETQGGSPHQVGYSAFLQSDTPHGDIIYSTGNGEQYGTSIVALSCHGGSEDSPLISPETSPLLPESVAGATTTSIMAVAWSVAPVAICLWSNVGGSLMLYPTFTVVRSSGWLGCLLPQALFAVRLIAVTAGRFTVPGSPSLRVVLVRPCQHLSRQHVMNTRLNGSSL
jgi:hypothetical protein